MIFPQPLKISSLITIGSDIINHYNIKLQDSDTLHIEAHEWRYVQVADTEWIVFYDEDNIQLAGIPHTQIVTLVKEGTVNGSE